MPKNLRVLMVEDSEDDAEIILRALRKGGFVPESLRVDCEKDLVKALQEEGWDVVITDHNLPGYGSSAAIATVKNVDPDVPVIIVSGSIGEEQAVEGMKSGAHDYIMKNNLARLAPAIEREIRETRNRAAHRRAQETIHFLALHDPLTGLSNRNDFESRLKHLLATAGSGAAHALLYIDLDQFKVINDSCGHAAGDELLRQLALALREPIRETDMLARIGGDEFGVLLSNCNLEGASQIGERMLQIIRQFRFNWKGREFSTAASIGLTMIEEGDQTVSDVLRKADMACYIAKDNGRNRVHVYSAEDTSLQQRHGQLQWIPELRRALETDGFELFRQSIAPVGLHRELHCEFLLRLSDGNGGLVLPGVFIPAAERFGLMPELDRWVVRNAFQYMAKIRDQATSSPTNVFFINLSGSTLSDGDFCDYVTEELKRQAIPPSIVGFEITETSVIGNFSVAIDFINKMKELGCRVALDDFGTGLSTFSYLKALPADYVKIDGSFIRDMLQDKMDYAIVEAINNIGHVAGVQTIAEFVESPEIWRRLMTIGIDYVQGFAVHRPTSINSSPEHFVAAANPGVSHH